MAVYLLHWDEALEGGRNPKHYLGYVAGETLGDVQKRFRSHVLQTGSHPAKIVGAAVAAGREVGIVRVWTSGDRDLERALKREKRGFRDLCPACAAGGLRLHPDLPHITI